MTSRYGAKRFTLSSLFAPKNNSNTNPFKEMVEIFLERYLEKTGDNAEELQQILGRFAEISYAVTGNGSYLYEKGLIKF